MIDLDHLASLALDATPGPWETIQLPSMQYRIDAKVGPLHVCPAIANGLGDARFIAALSPDVVLELIEMARKGRDVTGPLSLLATRSLLRRAMALLGDYQTGAIYATPGVVAPFLADAIAATGAIDSAGAIEALNPKVGRPKGRLDSYTRELSPRTKKIIAALDNGEEMKKIARRFKVSEQAVSKMKVRHRPDTVKRRSHLAAPPPRWRSG